MRSHALIEISDGISRRKLYPCEPRTHGGTRRVRLQTLASKGYLFHAAKVNTVNVLTTESRDRAAAGRTEVDKRDRASYK